MCNLVQSFSLHLLYSSDGAQSLRLSLGRLLMSMGSTIPEDHQQSWNDAISQMIDVREATRDSEKDSERTSKDALKTVLDGMHRKALARTTDDKSCLPVEVIDLTVQCVECVARQQAMVMVSKDVMVMDTDKTEIAELQESGKSGVEANLKKIEKVIARFDGEMGKLVYDKKLQIIL